MNEQQLIFFITILYNLECKVKMETLGELKSNLKNVFWSNFGFGKMGFRGLHPLFAKSGLLEWWLCFWKLIGNDFSSVPCEVRPENAIFKSVNRCVIQLVWFECFWCWISKQIEVQSCWIHDFVRWNGFSEMFGVKFRGGKGSFCWILLSIW